MDQKKEDEIMAEYLLKGGKMLEKTCRQCGCPQFEYKGKTLCVVCAERGREKKKTTLPGGQKGEGPGRNPETVPDAGGSVAAAGHGEIGSELSGAILNLCKRIKEEEDPDRCLTFMDAVKVGAEALQILGQL